MMENQKISENEYISALITELNYLLQNPSMNPDTARVYQSRIAFIRNQLDFIESLVY